uniref:2Fe-2S ferredoxin-type domain-containing protein n=1 Tax=Corethron hystrix TaxID=216773 RepID=A0A7S1C0U8_9STRA|mmetsp:Transcript_6985/g.15110  ORF Transcript_6985/g.15110 Transcript_6985/m.15110 type:complete len:154 (+) Transcript_6985:219-680(+)
MAWMNRRDFNVKTLIVTYAVLFLVKFSDGFTCLGGRSLQSCQSQARHQRSRRVHGSLKMNWFADAFKNEDIAPPKNAGLTNGPETNDNVTINGKKVKAITGQKVAVVASAARVRIPFNCNSGDCGTCVIKMNGRNAKACVSKIPRGKCSIETR